MGLQLHTCIYIYIYFSLKKKDAIVITAKGQGQDLSDLDGEYTGLFFFLNHSVYFSYG